MTPDLRSVPRVDISLPVRLKYLESGKIYHTRKANAENLSAKGLGLIGDAEIENGQTMLLILYLPQEAETIGLKEQKKVKQVEEEGIPVIILSKAAWCRQNASGVYSIGVEFLVPDRQHEHRLQAFLNSRHAFKQVVYDPMPTREDENEP
jgi:hypothetical protein